MCITLHKKLLDTISCDIYTENIKNINIKEAGIKDI